MFNLYEETPVKQLTNYFGPATVRDINEHEKNALLRFEKNGEEFNAWGKLGISQKLNFGDTVLTAGENLDSLYVIGVLNSSSKEINTNRLNLSNGSYVVLDENKNPEKFQLYSKSSELIFEYDSLSGTSRINIQKGNLEFITKNGDINFVSSQKINLKSAESIELQSPFGLRLSLIDSIGKILSSISLKNRMIKMDTPKIDITSQRADFRMGELKYIGNEFSATLKHGKLIIGKIENIANDIICKAKNIYNTVDELTQTKTGRMRTLIKSSLHIKSKNSYLKSEEDFKINAKKIHLG